jgi:uncharacterized protein
MSLDVLRTVLVNLQQDELLAPNLQILWHLGEPLAAGKQFYRDANVIIKDVLKKIPNIKQSFQTNGILIDQEWCELFKELNAQVGISIDGPKKFHDVHRVTRSGRGTFDAVMKGVEILKKNNIDLYVISVLTTSSLAEPDLLFLFAKTLGIPRFCFNIEETDGVHTSTTLNDISTASLARSFFDYAITKASDPVNSIWIREISDMMNMIEASAYNNCSSSLNEPFRIVTVDTLGNWSTFCPELLAMPSKRFENFLFGNLVQGPISKVLTKKNLMKP